MTELEIEVEKRLRNWSDLKDYPELFSVVVDICDTFLNPENRVPGDPRYKAKEIEPIKETNDQSYVY